MRNKQQKKGVMTQVINVFILILVISVLSGMTFLFVSSLKATTADSTATTVGTVTNESGAFINETGYTLTDSTKLEFRTLVVTQVTNETNGTAGFLLVVDPANYTYTQAGVITNATAFTFESANVSYTYKYIGDDIAYRAVNATENAGFQVTNYLTLLFLALIFGAVLIVVLRIILPYINVGNKLGSDGF